MARNVFTVVHIRFDGTAIVKHDTSLEHVTVNPENCKLISKLIVVELFSFSPHFGSDYCYEARKDFTVFRCGYTSWSNYALYWWCTIVSASEFKYSCYETCYELTVS
jgi:hypothetical protein